MAEREKLFSVTLKDCDVQTFRSGGPGGQHQNKTESGVRIVHQESGARGESREHRSQLQNKKAAFRRMVESDKFQLWLKRQLGADMVDQAEMNRRIVNQLDRDMNPANIVVEVLTEDGWVQEA